jgi:hypothetical protein
MKYIFKIKSEQWAYLVLIIPNNIVFLVNDNICIHANNDNKNILEY